MSVRSADGCGGAAREPARAARRTMAIRDESDACIRVTLTDTSDSESVHTESPLMAQRAGGGGPAARRQRVARVDLVRGRGRRGASVTGAAVTAAEHVGDGQDR